MTHKKPNKIRIITIILSFLIIIAILIPFIIAQTMPSETKLIKGKNQITTSKEFKPIYVKDFIRKFPNIEVLSYHEQNLTTGYINLFSGIGENFIIYPEKNYEIIAKQNMTISIK